MDSLKKHWAVIILIMIILGFSFYWFEWRPTGIREHCGISALERATGEDGQKYTKERYENFYARCINEKGL